MHLRLTPGETFTINTTQPVNVVDNRGTRIQLPARGPRRLQWRSPLGPRADDRAHV